MRSLEIDLNSNEDVFISMAPGLLRLYTSVGVIEGLDVNKENFDKYQARYYNSNINPIAPIYACT